MGDRLPDVVGSYKRRAECSGAYQLTLRPSMQCITTGRLFAPINTLSNRVAQVRPPIFPFGMAQTEGSPRC